MRIDLADLAQNFNWFSCSFCCEKVHKQNQDKYVPKYHKKITKVHDLQKAKKDEQKKSVPADNQKHNLNCDKSSIGLHIHW